MTARLLLPLLLALSLSLGTPGRTVLAAPQQVSVLSLDRGGDGQALVLPGFWFAAAAQGEQVRLPVLLLLHGCGGFRDRQQQISLRYTELAQRLNEAGVHALLLDSLSPRGEHELCTQRPGTRKVTQLHRRRDVLGALQWLTARPDVDASRLGLLGWSHGGSAVLASTNQHHPEVAKAAVLASLAVAYYPGCAADLQRGYAATAALLMLLGEADDWTPAAPCKALAAAATGPGPRPVLEAFPDAHHGFDGTAPLRLRKDVPGGANPGQGVHVGGHPPAREASARRLALFLRERWGVELK